MAKFVEIHSPTQVVEESITARIETEAFVNRGAKGEKGDTGPAGFDGPTLLYEFKVVSTTTYALDESDRQPGLILDCTNDDHTIITCEDIDVYVGHELLVHSAGANGVEFEAGDGMALEGYPFLDQWQVGRLIRRDATTWRIMYGDWQINGGDAFTEF